LRTIYNLQICRAVAAILVFLAHATQSIYPDFFGGFFLIGWCGIDFFFVLSGFIICFINFKYLGVPAKFKQYVLKRLARVYPIYWLYTLIVIVTFTILLHFHYKDIGYVIRSLVLYPFHTERGHYPIIAPAHTLTYELVFYTIFGIGILTNKKTLLTLMLLWLGLIVIHQVAGIRYYQNTLVNVIVSPLNIEFMYGCIMAHLIIHKTILIDKIRALILLFSGILLLYISCYTQFKNYGILLDNRYVKFGIPFSMIIYAAVILDTSRQNMIKRLFVKLGDASYSIYLIHHVGLFLLTSLIFIRTPYLSSLARFVFSLAFLIAIGYLAYKWLEQPLVKYLNKEISKFSSRER